MKYYEFTHELFKRTDFFMSENFQMGYRMADSGAPLVGLDKQKLASLTPAPANRVSHIARVHRPSSYYRTAPPNEQVNEFHDIIYGFFGNAASVTDKLVCAEPSAAGTLTPMLTNIQQTSVGGTTAGISYSYTPASSAVTVTPSNAVVNVVGGRSNTNCPPVADQSSYLDNRISIRLSQFDGYGNDTARALGGAFSYVNSDTPPQVRKYSTIVGGTYNYKFKLLPGLFGPPGSAAALFDGVKLYTKPYAASGGYDNLRCTDIGLSLIGFTEYAFGDSPPYIDTLNGFVTLAVPYVAGDVNNGYILCPTKGGGLTGYGGLYVGSLQ